MRGDIDGDGKITQNDRNRINEHLGGTITLTGADSWCAKVTGNNEISVSDLVQLMQYLEGKTNNLTGIPTFADYYNNWTYHKVDDLTGYWTAEVAINGLKTTSDAIVNISNDEGIFYKSELTDGAIRFYATRPPIAEVPATITFKSGTGVITTSYESAKFHASTHSKNGADPITPESIGALSLSGGTMTGPLVLSGDPAKNLEAATKQYVDNHTSDTVLYTPQTLADEQKAQARKNINSAPGGFGWGEAMKDVLASDAKDTYETYCGKLDMLLADMPDGTSQLIYTRGPVSTGQYSGAGNIVAVLSKILGTSASLIGLSPDPRGTTNGLWRMLKDNGNWQPVEWINPPMQLGVEYRTTERYLGKPVYVKTINMGNLPGNAVKRASFQSNNVVDKIVSVTGQCTTDSGVNMSMPYHAGSGPNWNTVILVGADGSGAAQIVTFNEEFAGYTDARITVKYTKLVD